MEQTKPLPDQEKHYQEERRLWQDAVNAAFEDFKDKACYDRGLTLALVLASALAVTVLSAVRRGGGAGRAGARGGAGSRSRHPSGYPGGDDGSSDNENARASKRMSERSGGPNRCLMLASWVGKLMLHASF